MKFFNYTLLPETTAYLAQCTTQPSALWTNALNTYIRQMIIDGNWQLLDRMWILASDNQQNARISIVNPTSTQISEVSSPSWTKDQGYTGNGTSSYLNTNWNPATQGVQYTLNNASVGLYTRNAPAAAPGTAICGNGVAGNGTALLIINRTSLDDFIINSATVSTKTAKASGGLYSVNRTSSTIVSPYYNGSLYTGGSFVQASTSVQSINVFICAYNSNGAAAGWVTNQISMFFVGSGSIDQTKLYNAFTTFRNTIGF